MMRLGTFVWLLLTAGMIAGVFHMKHEVQEREHTLNRIQRQIVEHRESIDILRAEWSYLNDPARLSRLNDALLGLVPIEHGQLVRLQELHIEDGARVQGPIERIRHDTSQRTANGQESGR